MDMKNKSVIRKLLIGLTVMASSFCIASAGVSAYAQEDTSAVLTLEPVEFNVSELLDSEAPYFYGIADDAVFSGSSYSSQLDDASLEFYEMILDAYSDGTDLEVYELSRDHSIENVTITITNNTINIPQTADDQFFAWYKTVYAPAMGAAIYDHPELSWLVNTDLWFGASRDIQGYEYGESTQEVTVVYTPTFYFKTNCTDSGTPADITNAVSKAQTVIDAELPTNADRYDTVKEIHDYIAENIEYNHDAANGTITDKAQLRLYQTAYSAFYPVGGDSEILTVCAGYAKGFKVLCDSYGIPNILVPGTANGGAHLWNYVKMDDNCWYAVDCTWDDQSRVYYDFFLIGSDEIPEHFSSGKFSSSHVNGDHYGGYTFDYPTLSKNYYERIEGVLINETNFPDANFRSYVADNLDQDANGTLTDEEISAVTSIVVTNKGITSLVGIEYFTELESLACGGNQLTTLDVSKNILLKNLSCWSNQLTSLDLSQNTKLEVLGCSANYQLKIDVSKNTALRQLDCDYAFMMKLDVSNNAALEYLSCSGTGLLNLDVSKNTALTELDCSYNSLKTLDLSNNSVLETLNCSANQLTSLDVSNTNITTLTCTDNSYTLTTVSLNELKPYGFDPAKASNWTGATYDSATNSLKNITADTVTYDYDAGNNNTVTFTLVLDIPEPVAPSNVKTTAGDGKVTVTWDAVKGATKYAVYLYDNGVYTCKSSAVTGASYTVTGLTGGTKYGFKVKSYANGTWSAASAIVYATPTGGSVIPENIKTTGGNSTVTMSWNAVSGATKYAVYMLENGSYVCKSNAVTGTSYTFTGLTNGTQYSFRVKAFVNGAWKAASSTVYGTPVASASTSVIPENIKTTGGNGTVTMTWNAVTGATKYAVYMLQNGSYVCKSNAVTGTSYTFTGLTNGTQYSFRVKAYVNGAWKAASATVNGTPVSTSTSVVPENIKTTGGNGTVTMTWNAVSGATKYAVYMLENGAYVCKNNNVTATSYTFTGLTNGTKYSFRVKAFVNGAWKAASATVNGTPVSTSTSVVPENIKTTGGNGTVTMTWNAVSGATKYAVYMLENGAYVCKSNAVTGTSYTFTGLTNGTKYSFKVKAYVNGAWKTASGAVSGTPKA